MRAAKRLAEEGTTYPENVPVRQLRLVVTAADYDDAVHFYRDVLGLGERDAVQSPNGRVTILDAGQARLNGPAISKVLTCPQPAGLSTARP